jgi:hypothetical protein
MEVKEALKWFEWADDVYYCSMPDVKPDNDFYKQSRAISNLLKSLESENKKLKAYEEMWEELKEYLDDDIARNTYDYDTLEVTEHYQKQITHLQIKYLGGGE